LHFEVCLAMQLPSSFPHALVIFVCVLLPFWWWKGMCDPCLTPSFLNLVFFCAFLDCL
jgi:hypothetical protein